LIYSAAIGLNQLAGNVIELARGGNRLAGGDPAPFSITDLMMSVCDIVQPIAEEKGIEMHVTPPAVDHRLGHAVALSRVLLNLTTNALKFIREGYVDVRARETAVDRVEFSVRDTGPGINQNSVQSLYSAFRPDPAGHGYVLSGTGLGLALCHKLVSIMGGTLQVETREKWGTRFYFDLTLKPVALI
jgi:signal transduction histidine kinase